MCYVVILVLDYLVDKEFLAAIYDIIKSIKSFLDHIDYELFRLIILAILICIVATLPW